MAPTYKDPDWIPLTPEAKTASTRRKQLRGKSGTLVQEKSISNSNVRMKAKKICKSSKRKPHSSNNLSLHEHQMPQILKRKRVTRKRLSLNKLVELTRLANELGKFECSGLDLSWLHMKRERSNTAIRRTNFSSTFAVHVRVQNECFQNMDLEQNMKDKDSLVDAGAEKMNCNGGDNTPRHPHLKVYQRRKNCGCPNTGHAILDQRDCNADVGDSDDLSSSSLTAPSARSMSGENGCDAAHDLSILETQQVIAARSMSDEFGCDGANTLSILETQQVIAARSMSEEFGCDGANTLAIVETQQVIADEPMASKIDEFNNSSGVEQDTNPGNEANVMTKNVDAWVPLTPPIRAKHADSKKNSGSFETVHSSSANNADGFMSNRIESESLIDILKKKSAHGVDIEDKKPRKRRKMKRYNPKVIDPGKPVKPCTPKPRTPKPARKVKKKKVDDPLKNVNGEATCKSRKISCKRKLDFDTECCTMDHEELKPQDRTCRQLEVVFKIPKICKVRRIMRQRASSAKLDNLIRMIREKFLCDSSTPTQVQEESVREVVVRKKSVKHREKCGNSTDEAKIQDNVLLIQDEAFGQAVEDFLTEKMESLSIEDKKSNSSGAIVLSKEKIKDPNKEHKPSVDIDPMTMIVWDLLMEGKWSEAAEAEAIGNDDYMKGQRNLFGGRIERLVSIMHLVQGNRNFSPWKGSILDSIIGVFLTQNVSDHLSSSAFMALRARYPPLSLSEQSAKYCCDDQRVIEPSHSAGEEPNPVSRVEQPVENGNESHSEAPDAAPKGKKKGKGKKKPIIIDWEPFRKQYSHGMSRERTEDNADSMNYEAITQASADEIAAVIKQRGMNYQLARRIKRFLDRLMRDHGSLDLEWLRYAPPLKVKEFLESVSGLGLKSTECVRLLALRFCAFPVDTNAGRFFVRMGWVPLRPLPEDVQLHLLEQYPILDSIQKYLWPRICDMSYALLYQTHCHSVTIAKSFCTKIKPNCTECPMNGECRHYASEFASAKPRLEGPQPKSGGESSSQEAPMLTNLDDDDESRRNQCSSSNSGPIIEFPPSPVAERASGDGNSGPIIEFPPSPVPDEPFDIDIEDMGREPEITTIKLSGKEFSNEIIPCIKLSGREFSKDFHSLVGKNDKLAKALVAISPQVDSAPMPKPTVPLRLRTVHLVYELPDSHPLLAKFDKREPEDPSPYLLAIWKADEPNEEEDTSCDEGSPFALSHQQGAIKGTILIPCRTANRGAFPLNGTYFQINEVFADHESSRRPIDVPREWLRGLMTRFLYCGTSITSICRGMELREVAYCFRESSICTRGFDTKSGAAKSLARRFHLCKSRENSKNKENSKKVK